TKAESSQEDKPEDDAEKFDLITIVSSEEKEIPEKEPPVDLILSFYIPEDTKPLAASKEDHVSSAGKGGKV
ncbi:MAG: hypothetical protein ACTSRA_02865, partial [Promethearchaeota archaeon]